METIWLHSYLRWWLSYEQTLLQFPLFLFIAYFDPYIFHCGGVFLAQMCALPIGRAVIAYLLILLSRTQKDLKFLTGNKYADNYILLRAFHRKGHSF